MNTHDRAGEWLAPVTPLPGVVVPLDADSTLTETTDQAKTRAENVAMHALTRRALSYREMERLLRSKDLPDAVVVSECDRLMRVGLLDDYAFAVDLVERLQRRKGLGISALKAELVKRLVLPAAIDAAVSKIDTDQVSLAIAEARKHASRLGSYDRETAHRRLYGYLSRRGFRGSEITAAIREVLVDV